MPLVALNKFRSHISKQYFYIFGKKSATNVYFCLFASIFIICFISYPILLNLSILQDPKDFIDAHVWQFSPYIHVTKIIPPNECQYIAEQIHIEIGQHNDISTRFLLNTLSLHNVLTTSYVTWQGGFFSLQDICVTTPEANCLLYSPLTYWNLNKTLIKQDTNYKQTINHYLHSSNLRHPYATMGNVTQDSNHQFLSADSFIFTILLKQTPTSLLQWDILWKHTLQQFNFTVNRLDIPNTILQYKFKILPPISYHTLIIVLVSISLFFLIKKQFGKSDLIKSKSGLCVATLFLSLACYTTSLGIFDFFHVNIQVTPWFLQILVCTTATLEHALLLTWAVVSSERGISVKERIGRGLQQVGILMTSTLIGELIVLAIGNSMNARNVQTFCAFTSIALVTAYILNLTFFVAILSIDIKRAELSDLDNDEPKSNVQEDYCQKFKSKRALNAFLLCIILLYLGLFSAEANTPEQDKFKLNQLISISNRFWQVLNPSYDTVYLNIQSPYIIQLSQDTLANKLRLNQINLNYSNKLSKFVNSTIQDGQFNLLDYLNIALVSLLSINVPGVLLFVIMVGILMWMTPYIRERTLLPILRTLFIQLFTLLLGIVSRIIPVKADSIIRRVESDYNEDGIHLGAISLRSEYNKLQNQNTIQNITVGTLNGKHISDICQLDSGPNLILSLDQDHQIILWDLKKSEWIARLDTVKKVNGIWTAEKRNDSNNRRCISRQLMGAKCIAIDPQENWVTAGFEDGIVGIWNIKNFHLVHEIDTTNNELHHHHQGKDPVIKVLILDHIVLSVNKSGILFECNMETGDIIQCIESGHVREITAIQVLSNSIFTASKDGIIKGWKRSTFQGISQWKLLFTMNGHDGHSITCLNAQQLNDESGIIVTGSTDGSVKVWNYYSGQTICTLSKGGTIKKCNLQRPLLQFSKVIQPDNTKQELILSNHTDAVCQVVVTPIENPEFKNDQCSNCHTIINTGFFVASCSLDETVLVWRLDCTQMAEVGCIQCAKNYYGHNSTRSSWRSVQDDSPFTKPSIPSLRLQQKKKTLNTSGSKKKPPSKELTLQPLFLGKVNQFSGRGIVFCKDMILAGIRHTQPGSIQQDGWQSWFVCLRYYEPPPLEEKTFLIPVITHDLQISEINQKKTTKASSSVWNQFLLYTFGLKKAAGRKPIERKTKKKNQMVIEHEEIEEEAYTVLPFSSIKYVVKTDGHGLSCDYGNFIKVISFDNPSKKYI